jgi:hypothetical protein
MKRDKVLEYIDFESLERDVKQHFKNITSKNRSLSGYSNIATNSITIDSKNSEVYGYAIRIPFIYTAGLSNSMMNKISNSFYNSVGIKMETYVKYQIFESNDANSTNTFLLFNLTDVLKTYQKMNPINSMHRICEVEEFTPVPFLEANNQANYPSPITEEIGKQDRIKRNPGCCSLFYCFRTYKNPKCTTRWFIISLIIDLVLLLTMWYLMGWVGLF